MQRGEVEKLEREEQLQQEGGEGTEATGGGREGGGGEARGAVEKELEARGVWKKGWRGKADFGAEL